MNFNINDYISDNEINYKTKNNKKWEEFLLKKKLICKNYNFENIDNNCFIIKYNKYLLNI